MGSPRSDPWRLACPDCDSRSLRARTTGGYYCLYCKQAVRRAVDKKTGNLIGGGAR